MRQRRVGPANPAQPFEKMGAKSEKLKECPRLEEETL
jgi:hypothetical protein